MEALRRTYRNHARRFVKAQPGDEDMKKWAIAAYQVTHEVERTAQYVNIHNESRRGSTPGSTYGDEGLHEEQDAEVPRRQLISFPWVWAIEVRAPSETFESSLIGSRSCAMLLQTILLRKRRRKMTQLCCKARWRMSNCVYYFV